MAKSNEEIIAEYRERFEAMMTKCETEPAEMYSPDARRLMIELFYIMETHKADSSASLLQAKLAYDRDEELQAQWRSFDVNSRTKEVMEFWLDDESPTVS